jgi:hypothetical protein
MAQSRHAIQNGNESAIQAQCATVWRDRATGYTNDIVAIMDCERLRIALFVLSNHNAIIIRKDHGIFVSRNIRLLAAPGRIHEHDRPQ